MHGKKTILGCDPLSSSRRVVRRAPITEITLWLEGFGRLASVLTSRYPGKAAEMWAYQSSIIHAARNYDGTAWVVYNRQFRREALARRDLNWSATNVQLYSEAFTRRAKVIPRCRYCLSETHDLRACPVNPDNLDPTSRRQSKSRRFGEGHPYTAELVALQSCMSAPMLLIGSFEGGRTPLKPMAWEMALAGHPDRRFVSYICTGLKEGFRIGFNHHSHPLKSAAANMFSAQQHPEIIQNYISNELKMGRLLGPLGTNHHHAIHVNRFGVIPKGNSGKWRLITNLSYPPGNSVNDGIDPKLCSLKYTSVEDVAGIAAKLGQGALMAKVDTEAAYRLVPVHPQDRPLLGMEWGGDIFVDPMLPFGL
eukprot:Em0021g493a